MINESKIIKIHNSGSGSGSVDGSGSGYGSGDGSGYGDGSGNGYGNGSGNGSGYGSGDGSGYGSGSYYIMKFNKWYEIKDEIENSLCNNLHIDDYNKIDKEFVQCVNNLESLRSLRENIGLGNYITLLDAKEIHNEIDKQGNEMKLYKYYESGEKVILLEVICPATMRMYHLYPPNQKSKTCSEAKASTFGEKEFIPLFET